MRCAVAGLGVLFFVLLVSCRPGGYPLKTCVVCDQALERQGGPIVFVDEGLEIKVCGQEHRREFLRDRDRYRKKVREVKVL